MDKTTKYSILTNYYRPKPGGFCKRYFRAINALLERGHTVHYLAVVEYPIHHKNCHFHPFPWPRKFTDNLLFWAVLHVVSPVLLTFIGIRHRVTHAFAFNPTYGLFLQPVRRIRQIPLCIFYRADHITNHIIKQKSNWIVRLEMFLERLAVSKTHVYCVSEALSHALKDRISAKDTVIEVFQNNIEKRDIHRIPDEKFHVAAVGSIEKRKNLEIIIRALTGMLHENVILDIYGDGPCRSRLQALAEELGVGAMTRFHGWKAAEDIWPRVDLLLMPSHHEGSPNAVLEAIGAGIPVLASDIPEHRDILPESQLLNNSDPLQWEKRIRDILIDRDKQLRDMVINQDRESARLVFDWDEGVVQKILFGSAE